jgi:hypothetical protein
MRETVDDVRIRVDTGREPHLVKPTSIDEIIIDDGV